MSVIFGETLKMRGRCIKKSALLTVLIFLFVLSCVSTITPSDKTASKLLEDYYSFYEEKDVYVTIINRGEFIEDCQCYPIEFFIGSGSSNSKKIFYFHKNESGSFEIEKFKFGIKHSS
jgi:hypothetical protein